MLTCVQIIYTYTEQSCISLFNYPFFHSPPEKKFLYANCKDCKAPGYHNYKNVHIPSITE